MKQGRGEPMTRSKKCDAKFRADSTRFVALLIGRAFCSESASYVGCVVEEKYITEDDFALR
jgi:hypothetical protein